MCFRVGPALHPVRRFVLLSLANLVLGKQHIWDAAADLVDVLAIWADHLSFYDVDLCGTKQSQFAEHQVSIPVVHPFTVLSGLTPK